jgi:uncharacterized membrane protein
MQPIKRFVEWYLNAPPATPGEDTAWSFSSRLPWPVWLPSWSLLLAGLLAVGLVIWIYWKDARKSPRWARLTLISLRLATLALLLVLLTELTLTIDRTGLPFIAVMIDDSASQSLHDQFPDERIQAQAKSLIEQARYEEMSRLNLAKAILTGGDGQFLKQLLRRHKLRLYRFSETAVPLGNSEYRQSDELAELLPLIEGLRAEGAQTRPGPAVKKVLDDFRGAPPSAIVMFSDGITSTTDADRLTGVADLARSKLVPIFTVGIGSEEPARDLQLYDLLVDEVVFVDDPISFSAKLKGYGYENRKVTVGVKEKGASEFLTSRQVTVGPDGKPVKVELIYTPPVEGEFDYTVEVSPLPKETNLRNNSETRHVSVRREKMRVLLVESIPRWEFRMLKSLLERDQTIELHTVLQDADLEFAGQDRTALEHFPVRREELTQYDVVILGDVNPTFLSSGVFENLREFVRDTGGGLILIAGESFNPLAYRDTPLESMLPVKLSGAQRPPEDAVIADSFRPELTLAGRRGTALFRFADSEQANQEIWNSLRPLHWLFEAPELRPGAEVFATHPTKPGSQGNLPVIALQRFGAGKVLFHATDETWHWRYRVGDLYYGRYWVQAIRFLSRSKLLGKDRTAELTADRLVYQRGDTVHLRVRFLDERLIPGQDEPVTVMVERQGDVQRPVKLSRVPQAPTVYEGQFPHVTEGRFHAWVSSPGFSGAPPSTDFHVEAPLRELQNRSLDLTELTQTARQTHGKYYSLADVANLHADLPPGHRVPLDTAEPIPLWNRWEVMLLFASLMLTEWLLRKRCRLV